MMRFKLMRGYHIGPDPSNAAVDRGYKPGDVIESPIDLRHLNRDGYEPKFDLIPDVAVLPEGALVYDPSRETLEQFAARAGFSNSLAAQQQPSTEGTEPSEHPQDARHPAEQGRPAEHAEPSEAQKSKRR